MIPCEMQVTVNSAYSSNASNKENKFPEYAECNCYEGWETIKDAKIYTDDSHLHNEHLYWQHDHNHAIVNEKSVLKAKDMNENALVHHDNKFMEDSLVNKNISPNSPSFPSESRNMINLENIMLIEKKILEIIDGIHKMDGISILCEDWWELSHEETMLQNLGNVFKEPKYKLILKTSSIVEVVSISLCYCISQHLKTPPKSILMSK